MSEFSRCLTASEIAAIARRRQRENERECFADLVATAAEEESSEEDEWREDDAAQRHRDWSAEFGRNFLR